MRLDFWNCLDRRLAQLSNRIDAGEADKIRAAIEIRIPKPTNAEIEQMEIGGWERLLGGWQGLVADQQKAIAQAEAEIANSRKAIAGAQSVIDTIAEKLRTLPGDFAAIQAMADERKGMDAIFLRILAIRAFGSNRVDRGRKLSLPKIISARSNDAVLTKSAQ